jgi:uncharacterized protein (TIGR00303 family)
LGFTETGLIPGISAAGATPHDRRYTALADAEFLYHGPGYPSHYPLPPLTAGLSPAVITRAIWEKFAWPLYLFNAGLPQAPTVPTIDLGGKPAQCLSQGNALAGETVQHLWQQGLLWGKKLAQAMPGGYLILGECVVGGTTTALAVLMGLGVDAAGRVNSSHVTCNHGQKQAIVLQGLRKAGLWPLRSDQDSFRGDPLAIVAAVGDPMQIVVAGIALAASSQVGVLLAGGTQMLAVYALGVALAQHHSIPWNPEAIVVGTTRWVAEDPTSDTPGLIAALSQRLSPDLTPCLITTGLDFSQSCHGQLRDYEKGYVKEGVAAGGTAIAATVSGGWLQADLLSTIDQFCNHARFRKKTVE